MLTRRTIATAGTLQSALVSFVTRKLATTACNVQDTDGEHANNSQLGSARHTKLHEDPKGNGKDKEVRQNVEGRLDDVEAVIDALGVGILPQSRRPVCPDRDALKQSREEDGNGMTDDEGHDSPDDSEHGLLMAS